MLTLSSILEHNCQLFCCFFIATKLELHCISFYYTLNIRSAGVLEYFPHRKLSEKLFFKKKKFYYLY